MRAQQRCRCLPYRRKTHIRPTRVAIDHDDYHTEYVGRTADICVVVPPVNEERVTAHTEGMCAVVWHLLVSHPALLAATPKWESLR